MFSGLIVNTALLDELRKLCGHRVNLTLFGGGGVVGKLKEVGVLHQVAILYGDDGISTAKIVVAVDAIVAFECHVSFPEDYSLDDS